MMSELMFIYKIGGVPLKFERFWPGCFVVYISVSCRTKLVVVVVVQLYGWVGLVMDWKRLAVQCTCACVCVRVCVGVRRSGHVRGLFMSVCLWEPSSETYCRSCTHRPENLDSWETESCYLTLTGLIDTDSKPWVVSNQWALHCLWSLQSWEDSSNSVFCVVMCSNTEY